jgi:hypothetical protein
MTQNEKDALAEKLFGPPPTQKLRFLDRRVKQIRRWWRKFFVEEEYIPDPARQICESYGQEVIARMLSSNIPPLIPDLQKLDLNDRTREYARAWLAEETAYNARREHLISLRDGVLEFIILLLIVGETWAGVEQGKILLELKRTSAQTSETLSRQLDDFESAQRAVIVVQDFKVNWPSAPNQRMTMGCMIVNAGSTAATSLSVSLSRQVGGAAGRGEPSPNGRISFSFPITVYGKPNPSDAGPTLSPGQKLDCGWNPDMYLPIDSDLFKTISEGSQFTTLGVTVSYKDVFNRKWITNDCQIYQPSLRGFGRCEMKPE